MQVGVKYCMPSKYSCLIQMHHHAKHQGIIEVAIIVPGTMIGLVSGAVVID
jgi:hypothetical protein